MSKFETLYKAIKSEKTLLGVGPVSKNTIDATIEISNERDIPLLLIASRRQVDCKKIGGGYVGETKELADYVRDRDFNGKVFLARDHGGPWQGSCEDDMDYKEAFKWACISYHEDIKSGFDIVHIDPSLKSRPIDEIIDDVKLLYIECEKYAKEFGRDIIYEVGTEEHSGNIHSIEAFEGFVKDIKNSCPKVKFVVGNTGLWVKEDKNIGKFNKQHTKELVRVCNENDLFLKAHNCDYTGLAMNMFGVHSANVAPEFGVLETRMFLQLLKERHQYKERQTFIDIAYESMKWKKWMLNDDFSRWVSGGEERQFKAELCGHYVFNNPEIKTMVEELNKYFPYSEQCKNAIKDCVSGYLYDFGW